MHISNLSLQSFRNIENISLNLSDKVNIFFGGNAQGKTNLLESIYFCATGRSHRTSFDNELVMFGRDESYVKTTIYNDGFTDRIDVHLKKDLKKRIAVNGVPLKKISDLFGVLYVVIFSPEDLSLIKSGPAERRRYIDMELCQLSSVYFYELSQYYNVLKQRNALLKNISKKKEKSESLFIWDEQLIEHGKKIIKKRRSHIARINDIASELHSKITGGKEILEMKYSPNVSEDTFASKLQKAAEKDIFNGSTSVGIQKDDISFFINGFETRAYGSQGQKRTASLSAKLAQINIIQEEKNRLPVLLLDDVLSELDESRQTYLVENISHIQTIITCTGVEDVLRKFNDKVNIYKVEEGNISL